MDKLAVRYRLALKRTLEAFVRNHEPGSKQKNDEAKKQTLQWLWKHLETHGHDPAHRTADPWLMTTINGTSIGAAFVQWYDVRSRGSSDGVFRWVAAHSTTPTNNDTCGYY